MITIHYPSLIILIGIEYVRCFMGLPPRSLRTNIALIKHNAEATKRQSVPSCAMIHGWWDLPRLVRSLPSTSPSWDRPNCEKVDTCIHVPWLWAAPTWPIHGWIRPIIETIVNTIGPGEHTALTFWAGESAAWWIAWPSMLMIKFQLVNRLNTTKDYRSL